MNITPVILAGGSGTRLWPLSRKSYPKQFSSLVGQDTLFQQAALRTRGTEFNPPIVITNSDFRFIVAEQLQAVGIDPEAILIEPEGKDTAPAVLAATLQATTAPSCDAVLVMPSDHVIPDAQSFQSAVQRGLSAVNNGDLVTFGIKPTHAETAYGYLELNGNVDAKANPVALKRFVEKPCSERAKDMLDAGNFLWNAGIFLFAPEDMIEAFKQHAPQIKEPVSNAFQSAKPDLGFLRLDPDAWSKSDKLSIDYAIMEKIDNLSVVPFNAGWSDLGDWTAVWREGDKDDLGVQTAGAATAINCKNTLLRSEGDNQELVGIGLENIMAIAMNDAVLVADRSSGQEVKLAVDTLREKSARQATAFPKDHRPWGWFESLVIGNRFQVKRICVQPGQALSLQSHHHRSEHWIVVEGTAEVTIGETTQLVSENQSVYISLGEKHRLTNPGKVPMLLVEVQTGAYLGEDDITRYDDVYSRTS